MEKPNHWHGRLLRVCHERPHDCPTADKRHELAPLHMSRGYDLRPVGEKAGKTTERLFLGRRNVRFGSKADMCSAKGDVALCQ